MIAQKKKEKKAKKEWQPNLGLTVYALLFYKKQLK